MSAESGMPTYRDAGGLWDTYPVMEVASDEGFARNPALIHTFYSNMRQRLVNEIKPNAAHMGLAALEQTYDVQIITQNVDDLHERAGSSHVLHLHGELRKVRSMRDASRIYTLPSDELTDTGLVTTINTRDPYGDPVRPHIVFFGEAVPNFEPATHLVSEADVFVIIGTSLVVYPAAGLLSYVRRGVPVFYIDPKPVSVPEFVNVIAQPATVGVQELARRLEEI